jgi:acetyl esterase/lipase
MKFARELLDPEFAALLSEWPEFVFNAGTLSGSREMMPGPVPPPDDIERSDHTVDDGPVEVTISRPTGMSGPAPCVVWMHGGGTIIGNRHLDNATLERWCRSLGLCSVSVEYRLAPEHPFPIPLEDCYQALKWTVSHADELRFDPTRIGVGGKSAGALLAASLTLLAREREGPLIRCQVLDCPMLDDRQRTPSSQIEGVPIWSRESNAFGWRCYLGDLYGTDDVPSLAVPARATDLAGLPPAFVAVGALDGLRDEDIEYATRLNQSNVPTELHVYPGVPHGTAMFPGLSVNQSMIRDIDGFVRRALVEAAD